MFWKKSKFVIAIGSAIMIVLMVLLTSVGMSRLADINRRVEHLASSHTAKANLLFSLRRVVRERSLAMYSIYLTTDPFQKDDEFIRFRNLASEFIALRYELEALGLTPEEEAVYTEGLRLIRKSAPLQNGIVNDMMDNELTEVYELMSKVDLPLEKEILAVFDRLVDTEQRQTQRAFADARREYQKAHSYLLSLGISVAFLSALITVLVIRRTSESEKVLFEEKEKAQVTLQAIGDGVITVDDSRRITYLNPVAEVLTGWSNTAAAGKKLAVVYAVINETTRKPIAHSVAKCDIDGRVVPAVRSFILRSKDGEEHSIEDSASPLRDHAGNKIGYVIVFRDVTHERALSAQLTWQAKHDALTGLANRRELEFTMSRLVQTARYQKVSHAFLYLDLDQFKLVNDTCGHVAGDELLKQLSVVLRSKVRNTDTLARLGGDEFGILLEDRNAEHARRVATNILEAVKEFRFVWKEKTFVIGVSIGLVIIEADDRSVDQILSAADAACYLAKDKGRNCVYLHKADDKELSHRRDEMDWATRLNDALENDQFMLYFQKVAAIGKGRSLDYNELLVRLRDNDGKLVSPMAFIPAAERYGLMTAIDRWVIRTMVHWLQEQRDSVRTDTIFAVNISAQSVSNEAFLKFVVAEFSTGLLFPGQLCFEITETAAISNWRYAIKFILTLKDMGVRFALDDFGSGMSSFAYLKNLPVDFLKIDGTFVRDVVDDPIDRAMVNAINQIGQEMGIKTIAEFVESDEILACLKTLGVDYAQGYSIHTPEPLAGYGAKTRIGAREVS